MKTLEPVVAKEPVFIVCKDVMNPKSLICCDEDITPLGNVVGAQLADIAKEDVPKNSGLLPPQVRTELLPASSNNCLASQFTDVFSDVSYNCLLLHANAPEVL